MPPRLTHCQCPPSGAWLCLRCRHLLARANNCPIEAPGVLQEACGEHKAIGGGVTEKVLLEAVRRLAKEHAWLCYHTHLSKRSEPGYPDIALAKAGHPLVLAELKTQTGVLTLAQQHWQDVLAHVTGVHCAVWRPSDMAQIVARLRGP